MSTNVRTSIYLVAIVSMYILQILCRLLSVTVIVSALKYLLILIHNYYDLCVEYMAFLEVLHDECFQLFDINMHGHIQLITALDYENASVQHTYHLQVIANDQGIPPKSAK